MSSTNLLLAVVNDIAVLPVRQAGVKLPVEVSHGHKGLAAPGEAEVVLARLPVAHALPHCSVGEPNLQNSVGFVVSGKFSGTHWKM